MLSIYPKQHLDKAYAVSYLPQVQDKHLIQIFALCKLYITNAALAVKAFEAEHLNQFNPLVKDSLCQRHTAVILTLVADAEVKADFQALKVKVSEISKKLEKCLNKPPSFSSESLSFQNVVDHFNLTVFINHKTEMLLNAHLLTIATAYCPEDPGRVTNYDPIKQKLSKSIDRNILPEVVSLARSSFSQATAEMFPKIVGILDGLTPLERDLLQKRISTIHAVQIDDGQTRIQPTSAYFSMQAALKIACNRGINLLFKERRLDKQAPLRILYEYREGQFVQKPETKDLNGPLLVIEGYIQKGLTKEDLARNFEELGLEKVILANAAHCPQFKTEDKLDLLDEAGVKEVLEYRQKAEEIGCVSNALKFIKFVHVYPSTYRCEKIA